jgi:hypothetical protein
MEGFDRSSDDFAKNTQFEKNGNLKITKTGNVVEISIKATVGGSEFSPPQVDTFIAAVTEAWNGKGGKAPDGLTYTITVDLRPAPASVADIQLGWAGENRSNPGSKHIELRRLTVLFNEAGKMAHEFGHVLGLPDEYKNFGGSRNYARPGMENYIMANATTGQVQVYALKAIVKGYDPGLIRGYYAGDR